MVTKVFNTEGSSGLKARVKIEDQRQWDGQGSPSEALVKSGAPTQNTALTDLQSDECLICLCICVCTYSLGAWKGSLQAKGFPS